MFYGFSGSRLRLLERDDALVSIEWTSRGAEEKSPLLAEACRQVDAYFDGRLSVFELPLAPAGAEFQQRVHEAMLDIELGHTKTYGDLAELVDGSAQAVGQACGANPIPIIIPCHRVVAANGLGGTQGRAGSRPKSSYCSLKGLTRC